jgi:hypothetical protein
MSSQLRRWLPLIFALAFLSPSRAFAQIPFYTDDADTTEKGKFHFEFFNEHDWLQPSSYPGLRQNTSNFSLNYGLTDRIELGVNAPLIKIFNARESRLGSPMGFGDTQLGVKIKLREEREHSRVPAFSFVFDVELPTGSPRKQIGSGVTDYWLYGILQKSLTKRITGRLNGGVLFTGNSSTGLIGIRATRGQVFTANGSLVREFTPKLTLGVELFGGFTSNSGLGRGEVVSQLGASYAVREDLALTFGLLAGRFSGSPRVGMQVGFAYDFK